MFKTFFLIATLITFTNAQTKNDIIKEYKDAIYSEPPQQSNFTGLNIGSGTYNKW